MIEEVSEEINRVERQERVKEEAYKKDRKCNEANVGLNCSRLALYGAKR